MLIHYVLVFKNTCSPFILAIHTQSTDIIPSNKRLNITKMLLIFIAVLMQSNILSTIFFSCWGHERESFESDTVVYSACQQVHKRRRRDVEGGCGHQIGNQVQLGDQGRVVHVDGVDVVLGVAFGGRLQVLAKVILVDFPGLTVDLELLHVFCI